MTLLFDDSFDPFLSAGTTVISIGDHGPTVGIGWRQHPAYSTVTPIFDSTGRLYSTAGTIMYYGVPVIGLPPDVDLEITFDVLSLIASFPSICGWVDPIANTMIYARADIAANTCRLSKLAAGVGSELVTAPAHTWTVANGQTIKLKLRSDGTAAVDVNGSNIVAATATGMTPGGYHGIRVSTGGSASTGIHVSRVRAWDLTDAQPAVVPSTRSRRSKAKRHEFAAGVTRSMLPIRLNQRSSVNTVCFTQDNVWTDNGVQYAILSDENRHPVVAKRTLSPSSAWTTADLSGITQLASPTKEDPHYNWVIAVSTDGHVHVSGNHHDDAVRYARTSTPGDITTFVGRSMTGANEDAVTYPAFVKCLDGTLLYFYRQGVSGDGDNWVKKYNSTNQTWSSLGRLINGSTSGESAYWNRIGVSPVDGTLHYFYLWRSTGGAGGADSNNDICHIKSTDNGTTWKAMDGTPLTLPITHASSPLVVDTAPTLSGLLNSGGADVDSNGHPHAVFFFYDANGYTQLNHVYHDGTSWHQVVETSFTYRQDLSSPDIKELGRVAVLCDQAGRTFFMYRHNVERPNLLMLKDVTPGAARIPEFPIWTMWLGDAELTFDSPALRETNVLSVLVATTSPNDETNAALPQRYWQSVTGWVISIPMSAAADTATHINAAVNELLPPSFGPTNTVEPVLNSADQQGEYITATNGTWVGSPSPGLLGRQWQRSSNGGASWTDIAGATLSEYLLAAADVGNVVRCVITFGSSSGAVTTAITDFSPTITTEGTQFLQDDFIDTNGVLLQAHTGAAGATWTKHTISTSDGQIASNRFRNSTGFTALYYASGTPTGAEYNVYGVLVLVTDNGNSRAGICARIDTAANTFYQVRWSTITDALELVQNLAAVGTTLATATIGFPTTELKLKIRNAAKEAWLKDAISGGYRRVLRSTDNAISAAGRAGVIGVGTISDTVGVHIDSVRATN